MRRSLLPMCALAAASFSGGLTKFSAGAPAQASAVNDNFAYLDTTKASKATVDLLTSAVNAKADNARLDSLKTSLAAKAEKSDLATLQAKVKADSTILAAAAANGLSMTTVNANLAGLRDTVAKKKDSAWIMKSITPAAIGALPASGGPYLSLAGGSVHGDLSATNVASSNAIISGVYVASRGANDAAFAGAYFRVADTSDDTKITKGWMMQLGASNTLDFWNLNGVGSWQRLIQFLPNGSATFKGNIDAVGLISGGSVRVANALDVGGNIQVAGSLKTAPGSVKSSDVADYVFEPSYKLASLPEVEAFTKEHKHLPDVPSAKEIEKGGLDLAQMNLVLLKKVEELTLHAIEQQKAIEAQRQEMSQMRAELEVLKVR